MCPCPTLHVFVACTLFFLAVSGTVTQLKKSKQRRYGRRIILQEWNFAKRSERFFKMYFKFLDGDGLSAMSPSLYADRFWKRCVVDTFEGIEFDDNYINVRTDYGDATANNSSLYGPRSTAGSASMGGNSVRSTKATGIGGQSESEQFVELIDEV